MHKILLPIGFSVSFATAPLFGANQGIKPPGVHTRCFHRMSPEEIEESQTLFRREEELKKWVSQGLLRNSLPTWVHKSLLENSEPSDPCLDQGDLVCSFHIKLDGAIEDLMVEKSSGLKPSDDTILQIFKNVKFDSIPDTSWPYDRKVALIFSRRHSIWIRLAPAAASVTPKSPA